MGKAKNSNSLILHRITISKEGFDLIPEPERLHERRIYAEN